MRLWSVHPKYLDARGLVALWREALLAQAVLRGRTKGYLHHPQLERFRAEPAPLGAIADYLRGVHAEAVRRGYAFTARRISRARGSGVIAVTRGQLEHEWSHLMAKLAIRDPERHGRLARAVRPGPHPSFRVVPGDVETWERRPARHAPTLPSVDRLASPLDLARRRHVRATLLGRMRWSGPRGERVPDRQQETVSLAGRGDARTEASGFAALPGFMPPSARER
jgi:Pyrimidine dimer DNA glycosylase